MHELKRSLDDGWRVWSQSISFVQDGDALEAEPVVELSSNGERAHDWLCINEVNIGWVIIEPSNSEDEDELVEVPDTSKDDDDHQSDKAARMVREVYSGLEVEEQENHVQE